MASTYSALKIELIGTGEQSGTWGTTTNTNLGNGGAGLEQAIVGRAELNTADFTANVYTMPYTDTNALQDFRALVLDVTATLSANGTINVPAIQKPYIVFNNSVGGYSVTVKVSGQTGVVVPNGYKMLVYNNGTDVGTAITYLTSLAVGGDLKLLSSFTENVYAIVDGSSVDLNPSNGTVQTWTLGASRSPTANSFLAGQSMTLMIDDGASYTVTWPSVTWFTNAGAAPTLNTTGYTTVVLWKVASTLYGARVGDA